MTVVAFVTLNTSSHCLLPSTVSGGKLAVTFTLVPMYMVCLFSLADIKFFSLSLAFTFRCGAMFLVQISLPLFYVNIVEFLRYVDVFFIRFN